jgi:ammonia channel protein AmtB
MMLAAITPLLLTGASAERLRWKAYFLFLILWEVLVFYPVAHWIWGGSSSIPLRFLHSRQAAGSTSLAHLTLLAVSSSTPPREQERWFPP